MHELTRLAYLEAMGIDSYVSRVQLPAAAPSQRLRVVRIAPPQPMSGTSAPVAPAASPTPTGSASAELKASLGEIAPARAQRRPAQDSPARPRKPAREVTAFSVVALHLGGWFWLEEIPAGREPGAAYLQLLQSIAFALELDPSQPVLAQFNWPMQMGGQLEQGDEEARGALGGFLLKRLEQFQPRGAILLGELSGAWFDPGLLASLPTLTTVRARDMLRQPMLKRQAWLELSQQLRDVG